MIRTFAAADIHGTTVVHDPATGTNHLPARPLPPGPLGLDEQEVAAWPEAMHGQLKPTAPLSMCWSPIVRCNLTCPQCLDDKRVRESTAEERRTLARHIGESGILGVDISGGEPLLLRDLPDLALAIRAGRQAVVSCTTNGWHLARRAPELAPALDAIRISLDGATEATHDAWRGAESYSRAIDGTRAAVGEGLRVQFQMVLMRSNQHEAQALLELAAQLGVGGVTFLQMLPIGEGKAIAEQQMLTDDQATAAIEALTVPDGLRVRLRTRDSADGFTVLRADGYAWRNTGGATGIAAFIPVTGPQDLHLPTARSAS
ncbi:radical SAM protein [Kitasatospora acidiphila]|uniref:Radical SAM protein n=1 Tax=Kitasatospora acidiphila TaxID=2567942 RepID=A0A540W967_9ACTN|nr:radical SAM protein [Kitasatospora acidiphila]TQF05553.1 radical SAM protein [Kitasatospora acidiphila]